jgi:hypothetical protein
MWEETAALAYSYWEARGGEDGSADDDWYRAEREVKHRAEAAGSMPEADLATAER